MRTVCHYHDVQTSYHIPASPFSIIKMTFPLQSVFINNCTNFTVLNKLKLMMVKNR